jgi:hypothetical protein
VNVDDHLMRAAPAEPSDPDPRLIESQGAPRAPKVSQSVNSARNAFRNQNYAVVCGGVA